MEETRLDEAFNALRTTDVASCDHLTLSALHGQSMVLRGRLDALELQIATRSDALAAAGIGLRAEQLLGRRRGRHEARLAGERRQPRR